MALALCLLQTFGQVVGVDHAGSGEQINDGADADLDAETQMETIVGVLTEGRPIGE